MDNDSVSTRMSALSQLQGQSRHAKSKKGRSTCGQRLMGTYHPPKKKGASSHVARSLKRDFHAHQRLPVDICEASTAQQLFLPKA